MIGARSDWNNTSRRQSAAKEENLCHNHQTTLSINFTNDGLTGPPYFAVAGPEQTLNLPTGSGENVAISGGVIGNR
jgi:hypothetical protein